MFSLYLLIIFIFAKKYKWVSWKEKLFSKINIPQTENNQV